MSIVPLVKVSLLGALKSKRETLARLQDFGGMHLIDVSTGREKHTEDDDGSLGLLSNRLKKAIRYLEQVPGKSRQMPLTDDFSLHAIIDTVLQNQEKRRECADRCDALAERVKTLEPWGDFQLPPEEALRGFKLWFYIIPASHRKELGDLAYPWHIVHEDGHRIWVVLIAREEPPAEVLSTPRFHTGKTPLRRVSHALTRARIELEDIELERRRLTRYIDLLKRFRARAEDVSNLELAQRQSHDEGPLFLLQGWFPRAQVAGIHAFAKQHQVAVYCEPTAPDDMPPTLLSNPPSLKAGELLVGFYQTPAYRSWDPSIPLFISFSLFFAMILSDAGYAAVLAVALLAGWKPLGRQKGLRALRPLLVSLVGLSAVWGVVVGSYFGRPPPEWEVLQALNLLDINAFDHMMVLSVGVGVLHLLIANLQQCINGWGTSRAWLHIGWMITLIAGCGVGAFYPSSSPWLSVSYGLGTIGLTSVFVAGGSTPVTSVKTMLLRLAQGLKALTNVTSMFGDVLSYLRLFALGLASASLALTFNQLSDDVMASHTGLSLLGGLLILLIGHSLNLVLAIVSGVVHGLRLNFIEFYKWALYGEGYPFKAFHKREYTNE